MIYPFFLAVTVLIFLCTAAAALRVIAYSQAPLAWFLVISGLLLMACMGVVGTVTYSSYPPQPITQLSILVGLLVSILWLIAILMLVPILLTRKRSDETFKLIITDSLQGLVIYQSGHIVFANLAFAQLAGTTVEDLLMYSDTDIEALFKSEEGEKPLAYFRGFPDNISEIHQDVRLIPRNGGVVWVEMFLRPALYLGKKSVQAIVIPLTDRRLNQQSLYESEQRHRLISSMISDYVYSSHVNPDGSTYTEWISGSFERITGRAVTQLKAVHTDWLSLIYSEDHPIFLTAYHSAIQTGDAIAEYRIFTPQGRAVWLRDYLHAVRDENTGTVSRLLGAVQDISTQKQAEQALRTSESRWRSLVENAPAVITTVNMEGIVLSINRPGEQGIPGLAVGYCLFDSFPPSEDIKLKSAVESVFLTGHPVEVETRHIGADGQVHWFHNHAGPIRDEETIESVILLSTDVTARKYAEEKLRFFSTHDTLTGLYNRAFFEGEIERLQSSRQFPISVVVADVNGLKETNDLFGHASGDDMLRAVAHVLRDSFRDEDVISRIGGDEFAVILSKTDAQAADAAIKRMRARVNDFNAGQNPFPLSIAAGAATAQIGDDLDIVIKCADDRMYADKIRQKSTRLFNQ